jgi:hypothetical protein
MNYSIYQVYFVSGAIVTHVLYSEGTDHIIPNDAQMITDYTAAGGIITAEAGDSYVTVTDNVATVNMTQYQSDQVQRQAEQATSAFKSQAQTALDKSDITILRCYENGVAVPAEWAAYRVALRAAINGTSTTMPTMPSYPSGT